MMKVLYICTVLLISFNFGRFATAWDNEKTHKDLSSFAADNSVLSRTKGDYLLNFGFTEELDQLFKWNNIEKTAKEWIRDGAYDEDAWTGVTVMLATSRWTNHFHNPLKPWEEAGLTDIQTGKSSLLWAQDASYQEGFLLGDWSWSTVRACYDLALTSASAADREAFFAMVFTGLGHQMHHIQDMSQPDHVRNDAHPWGHNQTSDQNLELWAAEHSDIISKLITTPVVPTLSLEPSTYSLDPSYNSQNLTPIALFTDADQYKGVSPSIALSQGIAEYTNANFASPHTIFTEDYPINNIHYFPYPRKSSTDIQDYINQNKLPETKEAEDGVVDTGFWIMKTGDGENITHFVKPTYLTDPLQGSSIYYKTFYQDKYCHEDYARLLLPRAVGYSAALLNYFFRGNINLEPLSTDPTKYVIKNNTDEDMDGTFRILYDDTEENRVDAANAYTGYIAAHGTSLPITFNDPLEAKESGTYILAFKGDMGNELKSDSSIGAVAGRVTKNTLTITPPDNLIYSIIDGSSTPQQFTRLKVRVQNNDPEHQLQSGAIQAVAEYRHRLNYDPYLTNDLQGVFKDLNVAYSVSEPAQVSGIDSSGSQEITFDFSANPIPAGIADLLLRVVYRGTIVNAATGVVEAQETAMGVKDISEPTHHVFWNLTDMFSLNYHLYTAETISNTPSLRRLVDRNHNNILNEVDLDEPYIDPITNHVEISYHDPAAQPGQPHVTVDLPAGRQIRVVLLGEPGKETSYQSVWTAIEDEPLTDTTTFTPAVSQDSKGTWTLSPLDTFRNLTQHDYMGVLYCDPTLLDSEGEQVCSYPESEAIAANTTPLPAQVQFE